MTRDKSELGVVWVKAICKSVCYLNPWQSMYCGASRVNLAVCTVERPDWFEGKPASSWL